MNKDQVMEGIEKLSPWFHKIELPGFGLTTKKKSNFGEGDDHPLPTWKHVQQCFPADLTDKTVLDIGCNAGFYAFEARKRNAREVLGVDARSWHIKQARFVQQALGYDRMAFRRRSVYELDPLVDGQWDVVLALGLVYHLKHLILGLENLYKVTRETLILESAIALPDMGIKSRLGLRAKIMQYGLSRKQFMPLFYVKNDEFATEAAENWFLPTPETLVGMLQDVGFSNVECVETFRGRALIRATKTNHIPDSTRPLWLKADYEVDNLKPAYQPGETVDLKIRVRNVDFSIWRAQGVDSQGTGAVNLSSVLSHGNDYTFHQENHRVNIGRDLNPNESCELQLVFTAPLQPGAYSLELDMVAEQVSFFQDLGSRLGAVAINVV